MKDSIAKQCLDVLKREDVKSEFKLLFTPLISFILNEINPYIYTILILFLLLFTINLSILFILLFLVRNKQSFYKN